jgi:hypothetical protein
MADVGVGVDGLRLRVSNSNSNGQSVTQVWVFVWVCDVRCAMCGRRRVRAACGGLWAVDVAGDMPLINQVAELTDKCKIHD